MSFITSIKAIIKDCVVKLNEKQSYQNVTFKDKNGELTREETIFALKWFTSEEIN